MYALTVRTFGGTPAKRAIARDVTRWFAGTHMDMHTPIRVIVRYEDTMTATECGTASWNGSASSTESRSYTITVNNRMRDLEKIVETLVHEMVHVRQMAMHELCYRKVHDSYSVYWKNTNHTRTGYRRQPWERQAHRLELPLTREYFSTGRLLDIRGLRADM